MAFSALNLGKLSAVVVKKRASQKASGTRPSHYINNSQRIVLGSCRAFGGMESGLRARKGKQWKTKWETAHSCQEWPQQTKPKKGQFMNFSQGHSGTKVQCVNFVLVFPGKKHQNSQIKGEIHELFVLGLVLVWFAAATPEA